MISLFDSELGRQDIKDPGVRVELILEGAQTCLQLLCESDASLATIADASIKEARTILLLSESLGGGPLLRTAVGKGSLYKSSIKQNTDVIKSSMGMACFLLISMTAYS